MATKVKSQGEEAGTMEVPVLRHSPNAMFLREVVAEGNVNAGPMEGVHFELGETQHGLTFSFGAHGDPSRVVLTVGWKDITGALAQKAMDLLVTDREGEPRA